MEDASIVADAIGKCFDAVLMNLLRGVRQEENYQEWIQRNSDLDPRVQTGSAWAIVDDSTVPITLFGA